MNQIQCNICKKMFWEENMIVGHGINHEIEDLIRKDYPEWNDFCWICKNDLNAFKIKYIMNLIESEKGSIENLEREVIQSIQENDLLTFNTNLPKEKLKIRERIADKVASFGGSWKFIIIFISILVMWIVINGFYIINKPFDPYPFILLNLILSCLAALQAPIIMMSQNRQEMKDRIRSENDYKINLKSEIEIRTLHEKVDHLLLDQWSKMMKIQQVQLEILEEISNKFK
ncbi:MAG: DUF1003 domain-containing protein [Spirochaetes bacterium]|nr:DUF1003 domain-containing protein [Spirochaetota bacterium]